MIAERLQPCPFCGGEAELKDSFVPASSGGSSGYRRGWVGCKRCSVYMQWTHSPGGAVRKWNMRPVGDSGSSAGVEP